MTTPGSLQLRQYLRLRRSGTALVDAAEDVGMSLAEARLTDAEEAKGLLADIDTTEPAAIGHNSGVNEMTISIAAEPLRLFLERIERLNEEIKGISDDRRDVFNEAKSQGYDVPTMRDMLKLRAMEKDARDTKLALRETYGEQLGLL